MAAGTTIKHKRKTSAFVGTELLAGEWGLNTNNGVWYYSTDGTTVQTLGGTGDMLKSENLSGLADYATARTNLGLAIGTNVQAYDADLAAIAALSDPNADRVLFWDDSAGAYTHLTMGTNLTITGTTLDASGSGGGLTWNEVTGTSQTAAVDNGYIANNAGLVTVTLPTTAAVGKVVRVAGKGAGGWRISQNASEQIHFGNVSTTIGTGGYLASSHQRDAVELLCVVADTEWMVLSSQGNITYV